MRNRQQVCGEHRCIRIRRQIPFVLRSFEAMPQRSFALRAPLDQRPPRRLRIVRRGKGTVYAETSGTIWKARAEIGR